jgi:septum site-determining protein MinC
MEALAKAEAAAVLKPSTRRTAFELKGVMTSLAVMRLGTLDLPLIERQLRIKIAQFPQFFQDAPVVLDLGAMPDGGGHVPLGDLASMLRGCRLVPVAVTNAGDRARSLAVAEGLGVLPDRSTRAQAPVETRTVSAGPVSTRDGADGILRNASPRTEAVQGHPRQPGTGESISRSAGNGSLSAHRPPLVVRQAVRGGQVVYAQRSDLVVLAPVNPGAEVIADGHVHIYSTLRGRAVAGAQGFSEARIFCQKLEAELVAVAGAYVMADDIPPERRGRPAQIYLDAGECRIGAL